MALLRYISLLMARASVASVAASGLLLRQSLLGFVLIAGAPLCPRVLADTAPADATAVIKHFNEALLTAMKTGEQSDFSHRFQALAPEVDQTFDLPVVLAVSVGPAGWASFSPSQQSRLLDAFRRYTVASYLANFNRYASQSFTVSSDTRSLGSGRVLVQSRIVPIRGDATEFDYVMSQTPAGWRVVDVLVAGSISRVAVQRSDFRHILSNGGDDALLVSLRRKTYELSGGAQV
jgi:phospholipid transport system substrate-binding protein